MGKEYPTRSFKSGNSVALRIPKEIGIEPGQEFLLVQHADKRITAILAHRRKEHFLSLAGAMSDGWMLDGRQNSDSAIREPRVSRDEAA